MKKARYIYLIMVLLLSIDARAQFVWENDGLFNRKDWTSQKDGESLRTSGKALTATGGGLIVGGAAIIGWSYYKFLASNTEQQNAGGAMFNAGAVLLFTSIGIGAISIGIPCILVGIPTIAAGNEIIKNGSGWELTSDKQSGFGLILEYSIPPSCLQARIVPGYHINQNIFIGAGVAPSIGHSIGTEESTSLFSLPVFADVRASFTSAIVSPYIGVGAGIETVSKPDLYLSAEAGVRYRRSQDKTRSFWLSGMVEYSTSYLRPGIKMGYSF